MLLFPFYWIVILYYICNLNFESASLLNTVCIMTLFYKPSKLLKSVQAPSAEKRIDLTAKGVV